MTKITDNWSVEKQRESNRKSYAKHKIKRGITVKEYQQKLKYEIFSHYSKGIPKCDCCGESIIEFLALDHINGGGAKSRKNHGNTYRYYLWLKNNNYPNGYRILCHNCNQATSWGRVCPHKLLEVNNG